MHKDSSAHYLKFCSFYQYSNNYTAVGLTHPGPHVKCLLDVGAECTNPIPISREAGFITD